MEIGYAKQLNKTLCATHYKTLTGLIIPGLKKCVLNFYRVERQLIIPF